MQLMSRCPRCDLVFPSGIEVGPNVRDAVFMHNATQCPRCGSATDVPDVAADDQGRIHSLRGVFKSLREVQPDRLELEAFRDLLEQAQRRDISEAEARARAEKINPGLAALLVPRDSATVYTIIGILVAIIIYLLQQSDDPKVVINNTVINNYITASHTAGMKADSGTIADRVASVSGAVKPSGKSRAKKWQNSSCKCGSGVRAKECCLGRGTKSR